MKLNKQASIFIVCFFIAVIFWFLISLNKNYNSSISFPIVYVDLPIDKVVVNTLPKTVSLELNARGFDLLGYQLKLLTVPIQVEVQAGNAVKMKSRNEGYLITRPLISSISKQLRSDGRVIAIEPDTIVFKFSDRLTKKIPVKPNVRLFFEKQYNLAGKIKLEPESVWVTGPQNYVDSIKYLLTESITLKNIKSSHTQTVKVDDKNLRNTIRVISKNITVKIPVEKYTEETIEIPIDIKNKTTGYRIKTIPDKVKISYLVSLSKYHEVAPGSFSVIVDFAPDEEVKNSKMKVVLVKKPDFIKILKITPSKVDYLKIK